MGFLLLFQGVIWVKLWKVMGKDSRKQTISKGCFWDKNGSAIWDEVMEYFGIRIMLKSHIKRCVLFKYGSFLGYF